MLTEYASVAFRVLQNGGFVPEADHPVILLVLQGLGWRSAFVMNNENECFQPIRITDIFCLMNECGIVSIRFG
jgi:hypothetical protein